MMDSLSKKTILITGASRGIGAATARYCVGEGAHVLPHAGARSAASEAVLKELCGSVEAFLFEDLSKPGAGKRLFETALEISGGVIDAVVNNAGVYLPSPIMGSEDSNDQQPDCWDEHWRKTMAVNVFAPADICRGAINHFRETNRFGTVINIASRAGHRGDGPDHAAYAASKGAILSMTKTWARALSGEGIHFYAIAPGWVETRMAPADIAAREKAVADIPLGRVAQPEEIASLVGFLLSGQCPSAVGATFDINGASYVR